MKRILIVLDVTEVEAQLLGDHLEELGPEYKGYGVKQAVNDVLARFPDGERLHVSIRSGASAALGGPDTPEFQKPTS